MPSTHLEPLLRIYEGCGRAYLGEVEGANIIKIHRRSGKLSYLVYPDFESDPHPALLRCVKLNLRTRQIECYDYAQSANPPVLHRKETFLLPDDPLHEKFARLTAQEEKQGLLDDPSGIGTRDGGRRRLAERGFALKGHRLVRATGKEDSNGQAYASACRCGGGGQERAAPAGQAAHVDRHPNGDRPTPRRIAIRWPVTLPRRRVRGWSRTAPGSRTLRGTPWSKALPRRPSL